MGPRTRWIEPKSSMSRTLKGTRTRAHAGTDQNMLYVVAPWNTHRSLCRPHCRSVVSAVSLTARSRTARSAPRAYALGAAGHCLCSSVSGTYRTPYIFLRVTVPASSLSMW